MCRRATTLTSGLAVLLLALALSGCENAPPSPELGATPDVPIEELRYPNDYTAYENYVIHDDNLGSLVLVSGRVLTPAGGRSPFTLVTLDNGYDPGPGGPKRYLVTTTDADGHYVVRGEKRSESTNMVWAATSDGRLGCSWLASTSSSKSVDIELRGGETVLHVRNENCEPIPDASVTVYMSGIDDMSEIVPPNVRMLLTKTTDENGIVRFPSRLGDHDLGFDVRAKGYRPLARDSYLGLQPERLKLFVLGIDHDSSTACANRLLKEESPYKNNPWLVNVGRPVF